MGNGSAEADPAQIHYKPGMVQDRYERNFSMGFSRGQKVNWADSHVCMELAFSFSELMSRLQAVVGKVWAGAVWEDLPDVSGSKPSAVLAESSFAVCGVSLLEHDVCVVRRPGLYFTVCYF